MVVKIPNAEHDAATVILNNSRLFTIKQEFDIFITAEYKLMTNKEYEQARRKFAKDWKQEYARIAAQIKETCPSIGKPGIFIEDVVQQHKPEHRTYQKKYVWKGISD